METKTDKQVLILAIGVILCLIGSFSRFVIESSTSSTVANILLVIGTVVSMVAVYNIIDPAPNK